MTLCRLTLLFRWRQKNILLTIGALYFTVIILYAATQLVLTDTRRHELEDADTPISTLYRFNTTKNMKLENGLENMRRLYLVKDIHNNVFYRFRLVGSEKWLGHSSFGVYHENGARERTLGVTYGGKSRTHGIQSWSSQFLSAHRDATVGFDRPTRKRAEMWELRCVADGTVSLWSVAQHCFVRVEGERLKCDTNLSADAAQWEVYAEPDAACRAADPNKWNDALRACWADPPVTGARVSKAHGKVVLFGTSKPLNALSPDDPTNLHDPFIIANRTLFNWALLENIQPVVLSTDPLIHKLVELVNENNTKRGIGQRIDIIHDTEMHKLYNQPTYRGLFLSVLRAYPDAVGFMFSNMDIIYSHTLMETLDAIRNFHDALRGGKKLSGGWFVVGRRRNVDVPADWSLKNGWERTVERDFRTEGVVFQSLAEDYFAVSRDMFDWNACLDFVVGGTAFDNWLTTKAVRLARKGQALVADATSTLTAIHQNHGKNVKASHRHPKSQYNNRLAHFTGGWSLGRTTDAPFMTLRHVDGAIAVLDKARVLLE